LPSRESMACNSSAFSSKSKTPRFWAMRCAFVDLGLAERLCCRCQRSTTCAGLLGCVAAMAPMVSSSRVLRWSPFSP